MDHQREALSARLRLLGYTLSPTAAPRRYDVLADGRTVFSGDAHQIGRWLDSGRPEWRERRDVETDPPGIMPLAAVEAACNAVED